MREDGVRIVGPVGEDGPRRTSPPRSGLVVAAAGFLLLVGGVALLSPPSKPRLGVPAPTMPPIDRSSSLTWSKVPHDAAVFGGEGDQGLGGVTVGGPGLVAVGSDEEDAMVLTSLDGVTWSRVPHDDAVFGGEDMSMRSVTVGGPGLVAVGWDGEDLADTPNMDAVVWTSADGITWSRVPHDEGVFGAAFMESVTAGGPGLVAVGMDGPWGDGDAAVWTSMDGFTWSRVPHDESVFGGVDSQMIYDVTVGGPGLVAVGGDGGRGWWDNNPENKAAVWTSVDGITWSRVPDDESVFSSGGNPVMLSVTVGGPGLVAVGADSWPRNLAETPVWTSPDGITWTRVPDQGAGRGAMTSVTAGGPGVVAVGNFVEYEWTNGMWTSPDGITWTRVTDDETVFGEAGVGSDWINDVTDAGPRLLAVGDHGGDAAVWITEED